MGDGCGLNGDRTSVVQPLCSCICTKGNTPGISSSFPIAHAYETWKLVPKFMYACMKLQPRINGRLTLFLIRQLHVSLLLDENSFENRKAYPFTLIPAKPLAFFFLEFCPFSQENLYLNLLLLFVPWG
ncbi:hypothetical protein VNO77_15814 [Canavalia gladiata]|uniref:Uncharacterized protein n=1 Tax=Canavalia gladiata TaxID=3824 RepID=A0AAN9LZC3_CANGL